MAKIIAKGTDPHWLIKTILLIVLFSMSFGAIIFSLVVLFTDIGQRREVTSAEGRGMFTTFISTYIDEVSPRKASGNGHWQISNLEFKNKNLATVTASDGQAQAIFEFIYVIEGDNIRILKINDVSERDLQTAHITLIRFLSFLNTREYNEAAKFYGGSTSRLAPYAPAGSALDATFAGYCQAVSPTGQCMPFTISGQKTIDNNTFSFTVIYALPDGAVARIEGRDHFSMSVSRRGPDDFVIISLPFD